MWGLTPYDNNTQINAYKAQYGITNPCAGTQGGGPTAVNVVTSGQPFVGYPTWVIICPDQTVSFDVCWPPGSSSCFDPYLQDCIDNTLVANFSSEQTEICQSQQVQYWDNSTGEITSWEWTFEGGDPATSSEENPMVTYNSPGVFDVELTVSNGSSTNTMTAEDMITVNPLPNVTLQPFTDVCLTWPAFELSGGLPEGGIYSGTGITEGWFDPSVAGLGTHTITYQYADLSGCVNTAQQDIYVDPCTGINETGSDKLSIFPNPATGIFTVKDNISGYYSVRITDLLGNIVYAKEGNACGTIEEIIDLSSHSGGLYFVTIKNGDKVNITKLKLLKE
jgi:PKD repeat protein